MNFAAMASGSTSKLTNTVARLIDGTKADGLMLPIGNVDFAYKDSLSVRLYPYDRRQFNLRLRLS